MKPAPTVLFDRALHTQKTVEALQKNELADQSDLVIYSDGPKDENDSCNIQAVHNYLQSINGFKPIKIVESDKNKGLADSVNTGVIEIINKFGRIIVLEDDLITVPGFLNHMNQTLENYEEEKETFEKLV